MAKKTLELLGARYHPYIESKRHQTWVCQRWIKPLSNGPKSSYYFFYMDALPRLRAENPGRSNPEIAALIGRAYRRLSPSERDYYNRKAEETKGLEKTVNPKCEGRLKFKRVNGRIQVDLAGLIQYTEHSEWCEHIEANDQLKKQISNLQLAKNPRWKDSEGDESSEVSGFSKRTLEESSQYSGEFSDLASESQGNRLDESAALGAELSGELSEPEALALPEPDPSPEPNPPLVHGPSFDPPSCGVGLKLSFEDEYKAIFERELANKADLSASKTTSDSKIYKRLRTESGPSPKKEPRTEGARTEEPRTNRDPKTNQDLKTNLDIKTNRDSRIKDPRTSNDPRISRDPRINRSSTSTPIKPAASPEYIIIDDD